MDCNILKKKVSSSIVEETNGKGKLTLDNHIFPSVDIKKHSKLHQLVIHANEKMAQNLVNINYDINARDSFGNTPLMTAVMNEDEKLIRNLITAGADVIMLNYENKTALQMVLANHFFLPSTLKMFFYELRKIFSTNEEIAQNLIDAGCRLYQAALLNDFKIVEYMLEHGFSLYSVRPLSKETELHIAVSLGNIDGVELLLKYASNDTSYVKYGNETKAENLINKNYYINAQDFEGATPLMIAIRNKNEVIIKLLLGAGADITMCNYKNKSALQMFCADHYFTPAIQKPFFRELRKMFATSEETAQCLINLGCHLYHAVYFGDAKIMEYMLKRGLATFSLHPMFNQTELHIAVLLGNIDGVELLLKYASNDTSCVKYGNETRAKNLINKNYINAQDFEGNTPLMIAIENKYEIMINLSLEAQADITMCNYKNKSALQIFCADHYFTPAIQSVFFRESRKIFATSEETARCLIDSGCDVYQAAYLGDAKIIELMLKQGLSPNSMHPTNKTTALHIAVIMENVDSVKLLLEYGANLNAQNIQGSTPLNYLYGLNGSCTEPTWGRVEILKMFLALDSLVTSCNVLGAFQISPILMLGNREMIRVILESNIDFTAKDQTTEMSVLHYLAVNVNPGVVDEIKLHLSKFDVNIVDQSGISPLHSAVKISNVQMVELLLSKGVSSNCAHNRYGYTPLYYAYAKFSTPFENQWSEQRDECIELLIHYNANPQFIVTDEMNNEQVTIFDAADKTNSLEKLKPAIAHLAVLEGLGISITEITCTKMNSFPTLKKYFNKCQKLMKKRISGSVTIFKLLTANEKQIARYSCNEKLMLKLSRLIYKQDLKSFHSYYYNSLRKSFKRGIRYSRLVDQVAKVICKGFVDRVDKSHFVINKIIDYLNDESLQQLYVLSEAMQKCK